MIDPIISYVNTLIATLGFKCHGLTDLMPVDADGTVVVPGVYIRGGEYRQPSAEEPMVYHRVTDGPTTSRAEGEVAKLSLITRTWTLRCVAVLPRDMWGVDSGDTESDAVMGLANQLEHTRIKSLSDSMNVQTVSLEAGDGDTGRSVWDEEFTGVDYQARVGIVAQTYTIAITAAEDCFPNPGCDDTPIDVAEAIRDTYCGDDQIVIIGEEDATTVSAELGVEMDSLADTTVDAESTANIAAGWTVSINAGAPVSTLVGVTLASGDELVFTVTTTAGTQPRITLTL